MKDQIKINQGNDHSSTLLIEGDKLTALGVISHGRSFAPATAEDAQALRDWLDQQYPAPQPQVEPWEDKIGSRCYSCLEEMITAYEADHDRLEELRDERESWIDDDRTAEDWAKHHPYEAKELAGLEEDVTLGGYEVDQDQALERITQDPLEITVLGRRVGAEWEATDYEILLGTGGPAYRIVGELGQWDEPTTARLEVQDWGKPWTEYTGADQDVLLRYAHLVNVNG